MYICEWNMNISASQPKERRTSADTEQMMTWWRQRRQRNNLIKSFCARIFSSLFCFFFIFFKFWWTRNFARLELRLRPIDLHFFPPAAHVAEMTLQLKYRSIRRLESCAIFHLEHFVSRSLFFFSIWNGAPCLWPTDGTLGKSINHFVFGKRVSVYLRIYRHFADAHVLFVANGAQSWMEAYSIRW